MGKDAVPDGRAGPELPPWPGESGPGTDRVHSWTRSTPLEGADATSGLRKGQGRTGYFLWNSPGRERKSSNSTSGPAFACWCSWALHAGPPWFCVQVFLESACWCCRVLHAGAPGICMLVLQGSACRCSRDLHVGAAGLCMQVFLGSACWLVLQGSACWCCRALHASAPGICLLVLWDSACRCSRALLFAAPHPQPPRNQSVAKGKNAKPSSALWRRDNP